MSGIVSRDGSVSEADRMYCLYCDTLVDVFPEMDVDLETQHWYVAPGEFWDGGLACPHTCPCCGAGGFDIDKPCAGCGVNFQAIGKRIGERVRDMLAEKNKP